MSKRRAEASASASRSVTTVATAAGCGSRARAARAAARRIRRRRRGEGEGLKWGFQEGRSGRRWADEQAKGQTIPTPLSATPCPPATTTNPPTATHPRWSGAADQQPERRQHPHTHEHARKTPSRRPRLRLFSSATTPKKPYAIESAESASDDQKSASPPPARPSTSAATVSSESTMPSVPDSSILSMTKPPCAFLAVDHPHEENAG